MQPDVAAAVEVALDQERALNEEKSRKVLEILTAKDQTIAQLQQEIQVVCFADVFVRLYIVRDGNCALSS